MPSNSSSNGSSDESRDGRSHRSSKRKREYSLVQDRRNSRKETSSKTKIHKDSRSGRDVHKNNRDSRKDGNERTHRERDRDMDRDWDKRERLEDSRSSFRDYSRRQEDRQNNKRRYERSQVRREDVRSKLNENEDKTVAMKNTCESDRRQEKHDRPNKFQADDLNRNKEQELQWGKQYSKDKSKPVPQDKEKPSFELSGKLLEDTNIVNNVVIKYAEPSDARKPKRRWRLYPFKGEKALPTLYVHRQSAYLMGRDRKVADIPIDHPSCSKQHAALQYRLVSFQKEGGSEGKRIRPYLIDLDSANGTFVNNVKLEPRRFHELLERDVLRFGFSSREYVLLHEFSKDDSLDDDVPMPQTT
ncbi:PREDICTED: smad nuclear interacting protein 1 [Polistes canadensis]|uniref:smad nuclear interacting protein 1 n=1 Tax=Polistes canadensis TaxID=91411 RepID=UPI000718B25E|nr:PREDICTED: smad nuclear interacting protein 1 [Polistes canadensis]